MMGAWINMKTPEEYQESLRAMRPNIYKFGELIEDVTTHPATKCTVEGHSRLFAAAQDPELSEIVTTTSHLTDEKISRYLSIIRSAEDMIANSKMKRLMFNTTGTCTGSCESCSVDNRNGNSPQLVSTVSLKFLVSGDSKRSICLVGSKYTIITLLMLPCVQV